jgi:uncharacterized protein
VTALTLLGAALIGVSLGLTGAGGSVITLPVLVYLAGIPPKEAVGMSLLVVGAAALVGSIQRIRAGEFHWKAALMFAVAGMIGATGGARFTPLVSDTVLMLVFGLLMLAVGAHLLFNPNEESTPPTEDCHPVRCLSAGLGIGILTGFIGVGGGFLLMPALVKFARLPMRVATGTSLAIISFNSTAGFISHLGEAPTRWGLALLFSGIAIVGVFIGSASASRLPVAHLRRIFAFVVLTTGCYVLWQAVS